jgi:hypothetical protein
MSAVGVRHDKAALSSGCGVESGRMGWDRMNQQFGPLLHTISIWALAAIIAITFHEAAHGFAALRLGDDTALRLGRATFNPPKHIDPMGTIFLPALLLFLHSPFLFGYAKPVPVRSLSRSTSGRCAIRGAAWCGSRAGPGINIVLAVIAALLFHLVDYLPDTAAQWVAENLKNALTIDVVLAVFNLVPFASARRRTDRRGPASGRARLPVGSAGTLRDDDPDRHSFHLANDRCANGPRFQHRIACGGSRNQ